MHIFYLKRGWTRTVIIVFILLVLTIGTVFLSLDRAEDDTYYGLTVAGLSQGRKMLAIVIDGFGTDSEGITQLLQLPVKLTCSVLPYSPNTSVHARAIKAAQKELMVHIPMEDHEAVLSGKYIKDSFSRAEVALFVDDCVNKVRGAAGANCYRGSKASGNLKIMRTVLDTLKNKKLKYYVDNRTNESGAAKMVGREMGFCVADRNVFLDTRTSKEAIKKQLLLAGDIAVKYGKAVAIGRVGQKNCFMTEAISELLPSLQEMGIELVYVSELFE